MEGHIEGVLIVLKHRIQQKIYAFMVPYWLKKNNAIRLGFRGMIRFILSWKTSPLKLRTCNREFTTRSKKSVSWSISFESRSTTSGFHSWIAILAIRIQHQLTLRHLHRSSLLEKSSLCRLIGFSEKKWFQSSSRRSRSWIARADTQWFINSGPNFTTDTN